VSNEPLFIELYKTARNSVEHFDKLLADFRKIIFAFNGIIISSGVIFFVNCKSAPFPKYAVLFFINFTLAAANILIWLLEKHYHRYLTTSALVARNIEETLIGSAMKPALAYQLQEARNTDMSILSFRKRRKLVTYIADSQCKRVLVKLQLCVRNWVAHKIYKMSRYVKTYDFLYIAPLVGSTIVNFILAYKSHSLGLRLFPIPLALLYLSIAWMIIEYNHAFTKRYKLVSVLEKGRRQNL